MTLRRWLISAFCALGLALGLGVPLAVPALAAMACPGCYGLTRIDGGLYSDTGTADDLAAMVRAARSTAVDAFGAKDPPDPTVLVCTTPECDRRLGGKGALARAYGAVLIVVGPEGHNQTILAHEYGHTILAGALGSWGMLTGKMPYWMNEGLVVLASNDARYLAPGPACRIAPDGPLPETLAAWNAVASRDHATLYPRAACAVLRAYGPPPYDLTALIESLP